MHLALLLKQLLLLLGRRLWCHFGGLWALFGHRARALSRLFSLDLFIALGLFKQLLLVIVIGINLIDKGRSFAPSLLEMLVWVLRSDSRLGVKTGSRITLLGILNDYSRCSCLVHSLVQFDQTSGCARNIPLSALDDTSVTLYNVSLFELLDLVILQSKSDRAFRSIYALPPIVSLLYINRKKYEYSG